MRRGSRLYATRIHRDTPGKTPLNPTCGRIEARALAVGVHGPHDHPEPALHLPRLADDGAGDAPGRRSGSGSARPSTPASSARRRSRSSRRARIRSWLMTSACSRRLSEHRLQSSRSAAPIGNGVLVGVRALGISHAAHREGGTLPFEPDVGPCVIDRVVPRPGGCDRFV